MTKTRFTAGLLACWALVLLAVYVGGLAGALIGIVPVVGFLLIGRRVWRVQR